MYKVNIFFEKGNDTVKVDVINKDDKDKILEKAFSTFYGKNVMIKNNK